MTAVPAHTHALADLPGGHAFTQRVHRARDFVTRDARQLEPGECPELHERVTVTDATGLDPDTQLTRPGLRYFTFDELEGPARFRNLNRSHFCHDAALGLKVEGVHRARLAGRQCRSDAARANLGKAAFLLVLASPVHRVRRKVAHDPHPLGKLRLW